VKQRFAALRDLLDERSRRLVVAAESVSLGLRSISAVSRATGVSRPVIREGKRELKGPAKVAPGRARRPGGGRKRPSERDPSIVSNPEKLVEPAARGDPESPLPGGGTGPTEALDQLPGFTECFPCDGNHCHHE
jgi:hypothetical protein